LNHVSSSIRGKIAREAANLLYSGAEKEYKQAKLKAAKILRLNLLPTNLEVALELDKIAEEHEGPARQDRLVQMRKQALKLMKILKAYKPVLVGSVWRGTIHHESDIDIAVYHDDPEIILISLKHGNFNVTLIEPVAITKKGKRKSSLHVHIDLPMKEKAELKICNSEEAGRKEKCEIYGDEIIGLDTSELERLLRENPAQRFLPV
jgi:predicted nucleotidyltransferase